MLTQNDAIDINDNGNIHEAKTAEVKPQNAQAASVSIDGNRPFVEAQGANCPDDAPENTKERQKIDPLRDNWQLGRFRRTHVKGARRLNLAACLQFDDEKMIVGMDDNLIDIYDIQTGRHLRTLDGHKASLRDLKYVGNTLVSCAEDYTVRVWDIAKSKCTHVFREHEKAVRSVNIVMPKLIDGRMQPAEPLVVSASHDNTLHVWRLPNPVTDVPFCDAGVNPWLKHTLRNHESWVMAIATHGNTVVSCSLDNTVCVWNLETGQLIHQMEGHEKSPYKVIIDPRQNRCLSVAMGGAVHIWDLATGHCIKVLKEHTNSFTSLFDLSPDHLISASMGDATVRVWDIETGSCRQTIQGTPMCIQHDNEKLIICDQKSGGIKVWNIKDGSLIASPIPKLHNILTVAFDEHRCIATIYRRHNTSFEILDFSVHE